MNILPSERASESNSYQRLSHVTPSWFKKFTDVLSLPTLDIFLLQLLPSTWRPCELRSIVEPCRTSLEVFGRLSRVWRWATSTSMRSLKLQSSWLETRHIRLQCRMLASPWRYQHHVVFFCNAAAAPPHLRGVLDSCCVIKPLERSTSGCPRSTECWSTTGCPAAFRSWTRPATFPYVVLLGITTLRQERDGGCCSRQGPTMLITVSDDHQGARCRLHFITTHDEVCDWDTVISTMRLSFMSRCDSVAVSSTCCV